MTTLQDYAVLSAAVYQNVRGELNVNPLPAGWDELLYTSDSGINGFTAGAYKNGDDIVIAFKGTDTSTTLNTSVDWVTNLLSGGGIGSPQVLRAVLFYESIKATYPDASITFTGHSLGGGLASLMSVFFDRPATTFDEAPFLLSANIIVAGYVGLGLALNGISDFDLASFLANPLAAGLRASNVTAHHVDGEALDYIRSHLTTIYGTDTPVVVDASRLTGNAATNAITLHSMNLLAALKLHDKLRIDTLVLPNLLPALFDEKLYAKPLAGQQKDFLTSLLNDQIKVGYTNTDGLLARFSLDVEKLSQSGVVINDAMNRALITAAIEDYYFMESGFTHDFFQTVTGGIGFNLKDIGSDWDSPDKKALQQLIAATQQLVGSQACLFLPAMKPSKWYAQAGLSVMDVTDTGTDNTAMIGGTLNDQLSSGSGNDFLFGGANDDALSSNDGNDVLIGGLGNDTLNGGAGYDRYVVDGSDTVEDSDGEGILTDKTGKHISGVIQKREDGTYETQSGTIASASGGADLTLTLTNGSSVTIKNYEDGNLNIHLYEEKALSTQFDRTIVGDLKPVDFDPASAGVQTRMDDLGNVIVDPSQTEPGRADTFHDSAGNDLIKGMGGNDFISSLLGGDDQIDGGDGDDWIDGEDGNDIVQGGAGRDVIVEGQGNDKLYAGSVISVGDALAAENATPTGLQGEALSGWSGNDLAIGGAGNDVLFGGTGDDILIAGAGNDDIEGDAMLGGMLPDWSVTRAVSTANGVTRYDTIYHQVRSLSWPGEGGADVIYAGAGVDWVRAGYGNDYVDGGNDDDVIFGEGGNDDVFGGSGNDIVDGGDGDDYLDGEDGNDALYGEGGNNQLFGGAGLDRLYGNGGSDYLEGEDGNDTLFGGALDDQLFGGSGNDWIQGDSGTGSGDGNDYLDGEAGDDILIGEGGRDELHGGDGADQIAGDNGGSDSSGDADTLYGGAGNDIIDGQGGDDVIDGGADNDLIFGNVGNDKIAGGEGNDQLQGGDGDDVLEGGAGSDELFGQSGNDTLRGGDGNDSLLGGLGDDILDGGAGDDVYYYSTGEGSDRIIDSAGTDWLVFTDINWGQIVLGVGSLKLTLPDGSELHIDDFDPDNPYAAGGIEYFQFADGTVLTKTQLIDALGIQPTGTPENDVLSGTALSETIRALAGDDVVTARAGNDTVYADDGADTVYGGDGNDILYGGNGDDVLLGENGNDTIYGEAGNDLLSGGPGTDALQGGEGDDIYLFQAGDGQDTATDALGSNAVVLGAGLTLDAIVFTRQGDDLLMGLKNSTDRLTVKNWFAADSHFANITLGDGTTLDHAGVEAAMPRNQAPLASPDSATVVEDGTTYVSGNALANDSDPEGRVLRITNTGSYAGSVGTLSLNSNGAYSYTLANSSQAVQSLAAGQSLTEIFAYTVTDDDPNGAATVTSSIRITVQGANDLPIFGSDSATTVEDAAPIGGNVLSNDHDVDANSVLTVANPGLRTGSYGSLSLGSDGAWGYSLANTSATVQSLAAGQTVTDNFAFNVSDGIATVGGNLVISIAGHNDAPIIVTPLADQSASTNSSWSWQMPVGSFTDIDTGDVLGYAATLADGTALPSWLAFNAATQTFSGRVPKSATGSIDIRIAATDRLGAAAADIFKLSFAAGSGGGGGGGGGNNGGGSQGNEGVGNGVDGPPPGHDISFNDGAGTGPGNPGAQGGNGYIPPKRADIVMQKVEIAGTQLAEAAAGNEHGNSANAHAAAPGQNENLSPGGGSRYQDLPLSKNGNNPVLNSGNDESIFFNDWFNDANKQSTLNLQAIADTLAEFDAQGGDSLLDNPVEAVDFKVLGNLFGQMRAANANRASWNVMDDLLDAHLFGADDAALGGDLAYQYGNLANAGLAGAGNVLSGSQSSVGVQAFQSLQGLQEGLARLG